VDFVFVKFETFFKRAMCVLIEEFFDGQKNGWNEQF